MKRATSKLFFAGVSLLASLSLIATASYAWMVLSQSPAVNGVSVTIGGGNTILIAPDLTATVSDENGEEQVVHYPGEFSSTLKIASCDTYDYLQTLGGLLPVSTADGCYWLIPAYDENGELATDDAFTVDDSLLYGNAESGGYAYLDFWVVSPGSDYELRVATDTQTQQGSYLVELPTVVEDGDGGYTLADPQQIVAACARVGFLVNSDGASTADVMAYTESEGYDSRYRRLLGVYNEAGEATDRTRQSTFTIYEPNGTLHPSSALEDGCYVITSPLEYDPFNEKIQVADIADRLTVQLGTAWQRVGEALRLEPIFRAAIAGKSGWTAADAQSYFYGDYLQNRVDDYLVSGSFIADTASLYQAASDGVASAESVAAATTAGATDGAVITRLQRNTPQRVRMYIWLEGQDVDCQTQGEVDAAELMVKVELAGSTT